MSKRKNSKDDVLVTLYNQTARSPSKSHVRREGTPIIRKKIRSHRGDELPNKSPLESPWMSLPKDERELQSIWLANKSKPHPALKMAYDAIKSKRSPKQAFILLVGLSGAGKSSTINYLFGREIAKTSDTRSETRSTVEFSVTMKSEEWKIKDLTLSVIDTPGFCDTDGLVQDARNMVSIKDFLTRHPFLGKYFPNLVFIVHNIQDSRTDGPNSHFSKMLKCVVQMKAIDQNNPNLVVVLSHAASVARSKTKWVEKVNKRITELNAIVESYLGITPKIVVQENAPDDFDLDKVGDWHVLPDGKNQPQQLFLACKSILNSAKDELGHEAMAVCFRPGDVVSIRQGVEMEASKAGETEVRKMHSILLQNVTISSDTEINKMLDNYNETANIVKLNNDILILKVRLRDLEIKDPRDIQSMSMNQLKSRLLPIHLTSQMEKILTEVFGIQYEQAGLLDCHVGKGYDIFNDRTTSTWPLKMDTGNRGMLGLPSNIFVSESRNYSVLCRSELTRDEYVKERLASLNVGVDANFLSSFSMSVRSGYNIKDSSSSSSSSNESSFQIEQKMYKVCLKSRDVSEDLKRDINNLPSSYDAKTEDNVSKWKTFFEKWGYHVVVGSYYGGSITGKVKGQSGHSSTNSNTEADLSLKLAYLQNQVDSSFHGAASSSSDHVSKLSSTSINWLGGDNSLYKNSIDNIGIQDWQDWVSSLKYTPAPLETSFELCPMYQLALEVNQSRGLEMKKVFELQLQGGLKYEAEEPTTRTETGSSNSSGGGGGCFPNDATVRHPDGKYTRMENVKIGDRVLSYEESGRLVHDTVIGWIHKFENSQFSFLEVSHQMGKITISPEHIVFVGSERKPISASRLMIGDKIAFNESIDRPRPILSPVLSIEKVMSKGLYAPLTKSGKLFVNDVLVSCYCEANMGTVFGRKLPFSHSFAHIAFFPLRLAEKLNLYKFIRKSDSKTGLHVYAKWLIDHAVHHAERN